MSTERTQQATEATGQAPEPTGASLQRMAPQSFTLVPKSLTELMQYAKLVAASDLCPKDYRNKAGDIVIAADMGAHFGLSMMQSLQSIAVINGRPTMWGDAVLAIVISSPVYESHDELEPAEALKAGKGRCTAKRKGQPAITRTFSMEDAKTAHLLSKDTPWQTYPGRMLQMRARSCALRDAFPDVLKGIGVREEVEDMKDITPGPIAVPRRASEASAPASAVDAFLQDQTTGAGKMPSAAGTWKGLIVSREEKTAKKDGKERFYWAYKAADGMSIHTTDIKVDAAIQPFVGTGIEVAIAGEFSMDTGWKATGVSVADEDKAQ